jgi:hypothetical protein
MKGLADLHDDRSLQISRHHGKANSFTLCFGDNPYFNIDVLNDYGAEEITWFGSFTKAGGNLYKCDDKAFSKPLGEVQLDCNYN